MLTEATGLYDFSAVYKSAYDPARSLPGSRHWLSSGRCQYNRSLTYASANGPDGLKNLGLARALNFKAFSLVFGF